MSQLPIEVTPAVHYERDQMDHRPWGHWRVIAAEPHYVVKEIVVLPGGVLSLQYHRHRSEHWTVIEGTAEVTLGDRKFKAPSGTVVYIPAKKVHRIRNGGSVPLTFVEIQTGDILDEDDIVRLEDAYDRT